MRGVDPVLIYSAAQLIVAAIMILLVLAIEGQPKSKKRGPWDK